MNFRMNRSGILSILFFRFGWLHHMIDLNPHHPDYHKLNPKYRREHLPNLTGTKYEETIPTIYSLFIPNKSLISFFNIDTVIFLMDIFLTKKQNQFNSILIHQNLNLCKL